MVRSSAWLAQFTNALASKLQSAGCCCDTGAGDGGACWCIGQDGGGATGAGGAGAAGGGAGLLSSLPPNIALVRAVPATLPTATPPAVAAICPIMPGP